MYKEMCPGSLVQDWLDEHKISIYYEDGLAKMLGRTENWTHSFLAGEEILDEEVAKKLTQIIGYTPEFWLKYERQYRKTRARMEKYEAQRKQETETLLRKVSEECKIAEARFLAEIHRKREGRSLRDLPKSEDKSKGSNTSQTRSVWSWLWNWLWENQNERQ